MSRSAAGRSTVFSVDPNYRAFTTGFQQILRNALLGVRAPSRARALGGAGSAARATVERPRAGARAER